VLQAEFTRRKYTWGHSKDLFQGCYECKNNWNWCCLSGDMFLVKKSQSFVCFVKKLFKSVLQAEFTRRKYTWGHSKDLFQGCYEWKNNWNWCCLSGDMFLVKKISVFRLFCEKAVQERAPSRIYEEKIYLGAFQGLISRQCCEWKNNWNRCCLRDDMLLVRDISVFCRTCVKGVLSVLVRCLLEIIKIKKLISIISLISNDLKSYISGWYNFLI
jgi:hypothetical protein